LYKYLCTPHGKAMRHTFLTWSGWLSLLLFI